MSNLHLLTTAEVAKKLDASPRQVARLVANGKLVPVTKLPGPRGAYLFDPSDFETAAS